MKRKLYMIPILLIFGVFLGTYPAYADNAVKVYVDETELQFDAAPELIEGKTFAPVRNVFEALGATVMWNDASRTVTIAKGETIVTLVIGDPGMYLNGSRRELSAVPFLQNGRTFVPLRAIGEAFGYQVEWNGEERHVMITKTEQATEKKAVNHRGYSKEAPENTLAAYVLSKEKGFTYVETDVQTTADGVPVLLHNKTIDATSNGSGVLSEMTYAQVSQYDFGSWKSEQYAGEKIPTFEEFIALCKERGMHPYIEVAKHTAWTREDAENLLFIVNQYGIERDVTWISFNAAVLNVICQLDPSARLGYLCMEITDASLDTALALKTEGNEVFLNVHYKNLSSEQVLACKALGVPLEVWTVNTEDAMYSLDPYVSGVTSDYLNVNTVLAEK